MSELGNGCGRDMPLVGSVRRWTRLSKALGGSLAMGMVEFCNGS